MVKRVITTQYGFTLLETIIAIALSLIVVASASNLLQYASNVQSNIYTKQELFQSAKISMDFIISQVKIADKICLVTVNGDTLEEMKLKTIINPAKDPLGYECYKIEFLKIDNQVTFGNQELASNIADVKIIRDINKEILYITITTNDNVKDLMISGKGTPLILKGAVSIKNKEVVINCLTKD